MSDVISFCFVLIGTVMILISELGHRSTATM
jgi:hypothetical protein